VHTIRTQAAALASGEALPADCCRIGNSRRVLYFWIRRKSVLQNAGNTRQFNSASLDAAGWRIFAIAGYDCLNTRTGGHPRPCYPATGHEADWQNYTRDNKCRFKRQSQSRLFPWLPIPREFPGEFLLSPQSAKIARLASD
jgi:hypothetical protein